VQYLNYMFLAGDLGVFMRVWVRVWMLNLFCYKEWNNCYKRYKLIENRSLGYARDDTHSLLSLSRQADSSLIRGSTGRCGHRPLYWLILLHCGTSRAPFPTGYRNIPFCFFFFIICNKFGRKNGGYFHIGWQDYFYI